MSVRAVHGGVDHPEPHVGGNRDSARVLTLLEANQTGGLTIAALRERGVKAPAQAVYELQLAGYEIDRVTFENPDGHATLGYRLRPASAPAAGQILSIEGTA